MRAYRQLGHLLVSEGAITQHQLEVALRHQAEKKVRLGEALLELGFCSDVQISRALATQFDMPFVNLDETFPSPPILQLLRRETAVQLGVVPVRKEGNVLLVVARNPFDFHLDAALRGAAGMPITVAFGVESQLSRVLQQYDQLSSWNAATVAAAQHQYNQTRPGEPARGSTAEADDRSTPDGMTRLINDLLRDGGVELHVTVEPNSVNLQVWKDGGLMNLGSLPLSRWKLVVVGNPGSGMAGTRAAGFRVMLSQPQKPGPLGGSGSDR